MMERLLSLAGPLKPEFGKKYNEAFAFYILKYCDSEKYKGLILSDAPDLIDVNKSVGVEVTEVIDNKVAAVQGNFTNYRLNDHKKVYSERIGKNGGKIDDLGITYPSTDSCIEKKSIKNCINKKINKYEQYKKKGFLELSLFLYSSSPLAIINIDELIQCFSIIHDYGQDNYKYIFLTCPYCLIVYDVDNRKNEIKKIPHEIYDDAGFQSRKYVDENYG